MVDIESALHLKAEKERSSRESRQWVIFCAKTIEAQAGDFWDDLIGTTRALLEQSGLPATALHKTLPTRFVIHRPKYPAVNVAVDLDVPAGVVRYSVSRRASPESEPVLTQKRLRFHLDDAGGLYLKRGDETLNVDDVAGLFINPFLEEKSASTGF